MRTLSFIAALLAAASLAACGGKGDSEPSAAPPASGGGPRLSVAEALESNLSGPLLVSGYLDAEGDSIRLCSGFAESYPPQCAGPSLEVLGYKLLEQRHLYKTSGDVTWSDEQVQLRGVVKDGTLTVSQNAAP